MIPEDWTVCEIGDFKPFVTSGSRGWADYYSDRGSPDSSAGQRKAIQLRWYRAQLHLQLQPLVDKWQGKLGVQLTDWRIKRMRTRWGGCNPEAWRAWFNLELAKVSPACLDYIVLHKLVHLIERQHNDRFIALLDRHLPQWRQQRELLNSTPLGEELWQ